MAPKDFLYAFSYMTSASLLIPVGIGVWNWSRLSPSLRALTLGLGGYFLILLSSIAVTNWGWKMGHSLSYVVSLLYGVTFTTVYVLALSPSRERLLIFFVGCAAVVYELLDVLFLSGIYSLDGFSIPLMTLALVVATLIFLYRLARYPTGQSMLNVPLFWVAGAKLVSGLSNGLLDLFEPQLIVYSQNVLIYLILVTYVILTICNLLYGVGIWKGRTYSATLLA